MIVTLTGGSGGAKLVQGMARVASPEELTVIVNTGDDFRWWGLHISPDVDSILYALAGILSRDRGWGVEGDSFECLARMRSMGNAVWFQLGDRDLATHLTRTRRLAEGATLTEVTAELAARMEVTSRVLPMSDSPVETRVATEQGDLSFQEYFVRERWRPKVLNVRYSGIEKVVASPAAITAIKSAELVILAPSNPVTSIGPILAVPGFREALLATAAPVLAVSPIVGGAAVSGPAGILMQAQGLPISAAGVAQAFADFLDALVLDEMDQTEIEALRALGVAPVLARTLMRSDADKVALAQTVLLAGRASARRPKGKPTRVSP